MRCFIAVCIWLATVANVVAQDNYLLQPGDKIKVEVWQDPKLNRELLIAPDGRISMPLAGSLNATEKTVEQVGDIIKERLKEKYQTGLDIAVSLLARPTNEQAAAAGAAGTEPLIYVMGEVKNPGPLALRSGTTVLQALAMSGGLGTFAEERRIQVHRKIDGRDALLEFDFRKFRRGHNPTGNIVLRQGDVVFVPENGVLD